MFPRLPALFVVFTALLLAGCKPAEPEIAAMGDASPAFGTGDKTSLQTFIVGRWCAVSGDGEAHPGRYYDFKSDGTFESGDKGQDWVAGGKWTVNGDNASLEYTKMKGKGFEEYRAEYKKAEETGVQMAVARALVMDGVYDELARLTGVWVDEDKKHLSFSAPQPPQQPDAAAANQDPNMGALMDLMKKGRSKLERMGPKKA